MKPSKMKWITTTLMLALSFPVFSGTGARAQGNGGGSYAWPYLIVSGNDSIWLYQPQSTSMNGGTLKGTQAVSIHSAGDQQERYGIVWFQANTNDAGDGKITLSNYAVTKQNFPSLTDNGAAFAQTIASNAGALPPLNDQKIKDDITLGKSNPNPGGEGAGVKVLNDPPAIIHSNDPALLVLIDGDPKLTPVQGTSYQRIINTNYLILTDGTGNYYTPIADKWAVTSDLNNPTWTVTPNVDALNDAKNRVTSDKKINVTIPDNNADEVTAAAANGTLPLLYVATSPTELLVTNGQANFTPIAGTNILYATNAKGDLFKSIDDNHTYTLISGRWYSAPNMDGPWTWVDPSQLPADFAKIPQDHPEAKVLVSIPNTSQANEAMISNEIPQTATVSKSQASFNATYDGDPKFKKISNTDLEYAVNSSAPVIQDGDRFYACDNAVWYQGSGPFGPWAVADHVPDEIYNIPSNSPVYNVTYVKVYDEDNDDVTFGYTPGYMGIYNSYWGCPVYGTGWWYRPWIGSYWWAPPYTYGYGAGFGWSPYGGFGCYFNFGFGFYSPIYRPWWGPWGGYRPFGIGYGFRGGFLANRVNFYGGGYGRGIVRVNSNPAFRGGAGLYHGGTSITRVNSFNRGSIYNNTRITNNYNNSRVNNFNGNRTTNGANQGAQRMNNGTVGQRTTNGYTQQRQTMNTQQRTTQSTQQRAPQQQRSFSQSRSYSAPARSFGGGGGYRGGGGGGGFHGGGGGGGRGGGGRH